MFLILRLRILGNFLLPATRGAPFLDPKFAQEHDAHISFGHSARVQQPAPVRGWLPGRLPGRQPARAHASNRNRSAHPARSQNSDRACTQSVGFMHARVDGRPRMRWEKETQRHIHTSISGHRAALSNRPTQYHGTRRAAWYCVEILSGVILSQKLYSQTRVHSRVRCNVQ